MNITDFEKQEFIDIISDARLKSYQLSQDEDFSALLERYIYNIKVSEAFYPILSILEIALRNKIHKAIDTLIKPNWLLLELKSQDMLSYNEREILLVAANKLKYKNKRTTEGALISELSLGFWVNLCKKSYFTIKKQNIPSRDNHKSYTWYPKLL